MTLKTAFQTTIAGVVLLAVAIPSIAGHRHKQCCPKCGCTDIQFVEVTKQHCRMVTEKVPIKKTVYETKQVPHCGHPVATHHHGKCPTCQCARMKSVLVKKEIKCGEKSERKCVAEDVTVLVPVCCNKCGCKDLHALQTELPSQEETEQFAEVKVSDESEIGLIASETKAVASPSMPKPIRSTNLPVSDNSVNR